MSFAALSFSESSSPRAILVEHFRFFSRAFRHSRVSRNVGETRGLREKDPSGVYEAPTGYAARVAITANYLGAARKSVSSLVNFVAADTGVRDRIFIRDKDARMRERKREERDRERKGDGDREVEVENSNDGRPIDRSIDRCGAGVIARNVPIRYSDGPGACIRPGVS